MTKDDHSTATALAAGRKGDVSAGSYLLVIEDGTSSRVHLPRNGAVLIGRTPEAELRLEHSSVSRRHARLLMEDDAASVVDLDSHNGTKVNGDLLRGPRALGSGDVISVGDVLIAVHTARSAAATRALLGAAEWRRRLAEEVERTLMYRRSFAVLAIADVPPDAHGAALAAIEPLVRGLDVVGVADEGEFLVLLPEVEAQAAQALAAAILAVIAAGTPAARAGLVCCPSDACDADSLLLAARASARAATPACLSTGADVVTRLTFGDRQVVIAHPAMRRVFDLLERLAGTDLPILVTGETGVGKENAAYAVHHGSRRRDRPFVTINCAALPETLAESELFGHERGAFSGAATAKEGLLESVAGGTIFLDEVAELTLTTQAKLLRAVEVGRITRLGETKERAIDVRIVAATNRDLLAESQAGRFRKDLYFRLSGATVVLPPLRDRRCEIAVLARELLGQACARAGRQPMVITPATMQVLATYAWPGNVRELRHVVDYVAGTVEDGVVEPYDLPAQLGQSPPPGEDAAPDAAGGGFRTLADELRDLERRRMAEALAAAGGVRTRAAELIGMPIRTFTLKLKQYGLGTKA